MRKVFFTVVLFLPIVMYSCKNTPKEQREEVSVETDVVDQLDSVSTLLEDSLVNSTLTDTIGNTLTATFDNIKGEVTILFDSIEVVLPQQVSASGICYSNDEFEFIQWQGETSFKHEDKVLFEHSEAK